MSTIVITEKSISFDRQVTWGEQKDLACLPKLFIGPHRVYCATGDVGLTHAIIQDNALSATPMRTDIRGWLEDKYVAERDPEFEIAVITRFDFEARRLMTYSAESPHGEYMLLPHFMGTGAAYARGAWMASNSEQAAMGAAAQCDLYTSNASQTTTWQRIWEIIDNGRARENAQAGHLTGPSGEPVPRPW